MLLSDGHAGKAAGVTNPIRVRANQVITALRCSSE